MYLKDVTDLDYVVSVEVMIAMFLTDLYLEPLNAVNHKEDGNLNIHKGEPEVPAFCSGYQQEK